MNNIINMVNYYVLNKNADDSVIEYLKNKIDKSEIQELIIIQIELLYTDPADKLVSKLVNHINNRINDTLSSIEISDLISLISLLKDKINNIENDINRLKEENTKNFEFIKTKDLNNDNIFDDKDSLIASNLIEKNKTNEFIINKSRSLINSINIWLNNLEYSLKNKIKQSNLEELITSYKEALHLINRNEFINDYISLISNKIENILLKSNLLDTITNVVPELNRIYDINYKTSNNIAKLLDYYIDLIDSNIK